MRWRNPMMGLALVFLATATLLRAEAPTAAPEERAEQWRRLRLDKEPRPPHPGLLEGLLTEAQDPPPVPLLAVPAGGFSLRPGSQRPGGGVSPIAEYWDPQRAARHFNVYASAAYIWPFCRCS